MAHYEDFQLIFDQEVTIEIRNTTYEPLEEAGVLETLNLKLYVLLESNNISLVRLELLSENDLFFYYVHIADPSSFAIFQSQQKLMMASFNEYPPFISKVINKCVHEPLTHMGVLYIDESGARLDFIHTLEFKYVELLSLQCQLANGDMIRDKVVYRYNELKSLLAEETLKVADCLSSLKRYPHVLKHVQTLWKTREKDYRNQNNSQQQQFFDDNIIQQNDGDSNSPQEYYQERR